MKNIEYILIEIQTSDIVFLKYVFTLFRVENIRSGDDVDTGNVHRTLRRK